MQSRERWFRRTRHVVKSILWREWVHGRKSRDEKLYARRNEGSRGFESFIEVHMAAATKEWIRVAWRKESRKGQISKVEATVLFDKGSVTIGKERYTEWKKGWKKKKKKRKRSWIKDKKELSNNCWQRRSFRVKYQSNVGKKTLAGWNAPHENTVNILIAGANDRNKTMQKD